MSSSISFLALGLPRALCLVGAVITAAWTEWNYLNVTLCKLLVTLHTWATGKAVTNPTTILRQSPLLTWALASFSEVLWTDNSDLTAEADTSGQWIASPHVTSTPVNLNGSVELLFELAFSPQRKGLFKASGSLSSKHLIWAFPAPSTVSRI